MVKYYFVLQSRHLKKSTYKAPRIFSVGKPTVAHIKVISVMTSCLQLIYLRNLIRAIASLADSFESYQKD